MTYADRIPAPRPIPTTRDRLRPTPHLDAVKAERDEALEARDVLRTRLNDALALANFRKGVIDRHRQELGAAGEVLAVVREAQEQIDRALARYDTQPGVTPVEPDDDTDPTAVQDMLDDATRAFADAGTSSERVEVIRDLLANWYAAWPSTAVTDEHEGIAHQIVALINAAEARVGQPSSALGSVSPHAQEAPVMVPLAGWGGGHSRVPARRAQEPTAEQALRDRAEHAIRDRLTQASKAWPADEVFLDQVAAVAAVAAVNELGRAEREG